MLCGNVDLRDMEVKTVRKLKTENGTKYVWLETNNYAEVDIYATGFRYALAGGASVELHGTLRSASYHYTNGIGYEVGLAYDRFIVYLRAKDEQTAREIVASVKRLMGPV